MAKTHQAKSSGLHKAYFNGSPAQHNKHPTSTNSKTTFGHPLAQTPVAKKGC